MPRGDRGERTQIIGWVFPTIGIVGAVALAWGIGTVEGANGEKNYRAAQQQYQDAKEHAKRSCGAGEPSTVFDCVSLEVKAAEHAGYDEKNLRAYRRAGDSALASVFIGLFTLALSGLGLWYVKKTLDATLDAVEDTSKATQAVIEANEIAREATHLQNRPWLFIKSIVPTIVLSEGNGISLLTITCQVENIGAGPSKRTRLSFVHRPLMGLITGIDENIARPLKNIDVLLPHSSSEYTIFAVTPRSELLPPGSGCFNIVTELRYQSFLDDQERVTTQVWYVGASVWDGQGQPFQNVPESGLLSGAGCLTVTLQMT